LEADFKKIVGVIFYLKSCSLIAAQKFYTTFKGVGVADLGFCYADFKKQAASMIQKNF
jgi:hypothetical protein